jgi:uncharacterized protein (DUF111 family)
MPNVLRAILMDSGPKGNSAVDHDRAALLESNIDDMNPQDFELAVERLFAEGALDVWLEHISMKKGRPGVKLCCMCAPEKADVMSILILRHTTTQGVRKTAADRAKLCYKIEETDTSLGPLRVKAAFMGDELLRRTPEYDDLKRLAKEHGISMPEARYRVMRETARNL